ncbi:hypothetical protein OS493_024474 [Desmophyllum pertusum]|uniref:Uncharacterized protein n=1 Tax=Desmophyllum pertusum TaxID=174260 RepID=A0A9W9YA74_9CNID|nr:hypothetical protein OS493_024474 [Desmophyllum pertusum]
MNHWGLAVFNIKQVMVRFDDGYHLPVSDAQKKNVLALLETCFCETGDSTFLSRNWGVGRFQVPMPDQTPIPGGSWKLWCCSSEVCPRPLQGKR